MGRYPVKINQSLEQPVFFSIKAGSAESYWRVLWNPFVSGTCLPILG